MTILMLGVAHFAVVGGAVTRHGPALDVYVPPEPILGRPSAEQREGKEIAGLLC